jgi:L-lactate dehydrogenase complex protein LldG
MNARDAILGRLQDSAAADAIAAEAEALLAAPERPYVPPEGRLDRFIAQLALPGVGASMERLAAWSEVPGAVARYLAGHALRHALYCPPDPRLVGLEWGDLSLSDACAADEPVAIARARAAVAETASLVFETGPGSPMLPNFLTLHQLVVVEESTIVAYLEDIPRNLAAVRAHYWVTGVSGTTDIEGEYVRGAHGPRFLHVLLVP